jgi:hypothetical protein
MFITFVRALPATFSSVHAATPTRMVAASVAGTTRWTTRGI